MSEWEIDIKRLWLVCFCETQNHLSHKVKIQDFLVVYIAGSWRVINEPKQSGFGLKPHVLLLGSGE